MPDAAHGGENWQPRSSNMRQELGTIWADCGATTEYGTLQKVLLHRPGKEIEKIDDPESVLWSERLDPQLAREQHDSLAESYRTLGVEVVYLKDSPGALPNQYFVRDLFTMTPQGAIIARPASVVRAGEERIVANTLAQEGVPILLSVHSGGTFEGPDLVFVDDSVAFVAFGLRTNAIGAQQVAEVLESMGIDVIKVQTTYGCGHLDGVMNIVGHKVAVLYPTRVSFVVYETLRRLGYRIVDLPDPREADIGMAINMVAISPEAVLMPAGNPKTKSTLEGEGIKCHEVNVSELMKGGGAVHCMTGILKRNND